MTERSKEAMGHAAFIFAVAGLAAGLSRVLPEKFALGVAFFVTVLTRDIFRSVKSQGSASVSKAIARATFVGLGVVVAVMVGHHLR